MSRFSLRLALGISIGLLIASLCQQTHGNPLLWGVGLVLVVVVVDTWARQ
jgi:hypothetical protein